MSALKSKDFAREICRLAADKKARDLVIIDLRKVSALADFYVIGTVESESHMKGIADHFKAELPTRPTHIDAADGSEWSVVDYFDVIVHLFSERKRRFYDIEELFADAPIETFDPATGKTTEATPKAKVIRKKTAAPKKKKGASKKKSVKKR